MSDNCRKKLSILINVMVAVSIAAVAFTAYGLYNELNSRKQGRIFYSALLSVPNRPPPGNTQDSVPVWVPYVDFDALKELMPDIAAWIHNDGAAINHPVVQGLDNEFYLNHLPDGTFNQVGSIFLDCRNNPDFSDRNSVIYGHHMNSGDMFGRLELYREQAFYESHPVMSIYTEDRDYRVDIFAGYIADAFAESLPVDFADDSDFEAFINDVRQRSAFQSDISVSTDDRLVSLCTCTSGRSNLRFVLVGKLIEVN
jgi:sortase B